MADRKIKVLMIGPSRKVHGGISGVVNNYFKAGLNQKIDLKYLPTMVEGTKCRKLIQAGIAYLCFFCIVGQYDIIHVNVASDNSYYRKAPFIKLAKKRKKKIVIHQHGGNFQDFYYKQLSEKGRNKVNQIFSMGDAFLVLAPIWKDFFKTMLPKEKITVLPDAIEIPKAVEKKYGIHKILFLGRICREKGVAELLEAVAGVTDKYPDVQLYLGGIWEDKDLRELADRQREHVTLLGWVTGEEKKKYLDACDLFVLPSYFEGQSISILEAMASSCAILASDTGGIPLMIQQSQTGLLCQPKDAMSLQQGLEQLLSDPVLCEELGQRAREKVEREFSIEKNMETLLDIYEGVINQNEI